MSTRLALVLAIALLLLGIAQWRLRAVSVSPDEPVAAQVVLPPAPAVGVAGDARNEADGHTEAVEEPELVIPEYVPPPVTERPRPRMGFDTPPVEVEIAIPQLAGEIGEAEEGASGDDSDGRGVPGGALSAP